MEFYIEIFTFEATELRWQLPAIRIPRRYTVVRQVAPENKQKKDHKNKKEQLRIMHRQ